MPRFSILLTVYNSEKYLAPCLDSVLSQTFTDFEVIAVDDGSTDKSGEICNSYAESDSRVKVFHIKNGGVFLARKFAEEKANGEYILHIDSDDLLSPELLQNANDAFLSHRCDLIFFDLELFYPNGQSVVKTYFDSDRLFEGVDLSELHSLLLTTTFNSLCHKCFSRRLLQFHPDYSSFHALSHSEDLLRTSYLVLNAESVYYIKKPLYHYRREVGASSRFNPDSILNSDAVTTVIRSLMTDHGFDSPENIKLFYRMCRKQFNSFFGLLSLSGLKLSQCKKILRLVSSTELFKNSALADGDSFFSQLRQKLIQRKLFTVSLLLQKLKNLFHGKD